MPAPSPLDTGSPVIVIDGVTKSFGSGTSQLTAVDNVSLSVDAGEIYGIVGFSGAGKSTLLRLVNALERPTAGRVVVEGVDLAELDSRALRALQRRIGMIFQQFNLMESRSVFRNVAFPLTLTRMPKLEIRERVMEMLDFVGLADKANAYPEQLSGGQKQRVGIARALATRPDILISDEATSALDPQTTDEVLDLLQRVNRDYGVTILLITHEMEVIKKICTRVAVMQHGRIVEEAETFELFSAPREGATRRFVSAAVRNAPSPELLARVAATATGVLAELPLVGEPGPELSATLRAHEVDFIVHHGGLDEVRERTFGRMLLELRGRATDIDRVIAELGMRTLSREECRRGN